MDKEQTKFITRLLVSAYLLYLSYSLIISSKGSEQAALLIIIGAIFLIASIVFIVYSIRIFIKSKKGKDDDKNDTVNS